MNQSMDEYIGLKTRIYFKRVIIVFSSFLPFYGSAQSGLFEINARKIKKINGLESGIDKLKAYRKAYFRDSIKKLRKNIRSGRLFIYPRNTNRRSVGWLFGINDGAKARDSLKKILTSDRRLVSARLDSSKDVYLHKLNKSIDSLQARGQSLSIVDLIKNYGYSKTDLLERFSSNWNLNSPNLYGLDSTSLAGRAWLDSIKLVRERIDTSRIVDSLGNYTVSRSADLVDKKLSSLGNAEIGELNRHTSQMKELKGYQTKMQDFNSINLNKSANKGEIKKTISDRFMESQQYASVMNHMSKLKGKYSSLLNSNDLSTGIKARSLKGTPFRERWVVASNFNMISTSPFVFDVSPQLGYRIDKRFQAGIGGVYRATFVDSAKLARSISPSRYGFSIFSSYSIPMNFFGYAEWERTATIVRIPDGASNQWVSSLVIGVGRKFPIHPKVVGTIMVLWNPLHQNGKSPYTDALVIKTGFQLTDLALRKK